MCYHKSNSFSFPLLTYLKGMNPQTICETSAHTGDVAASDYEKKGDRVTHTLLPSHQNVNRTCAYLQLSLLHFTCLTCFYPSRISASEQQNLLSASPSTLMSVLCLHLKHSTLQSEMVSQSTYITKKLPQQCNSRVLYWRLYKVSVEHFCYKRQINCSR